MDLGFIQQLIDLHERSDMVELEYVQGDKRLRLSKATGTDFGNRASHVRLSDEGKVGQDAATSPAATVQEAGQGHVLKSTLSGIFHRRSSPSEPAFVNEGDQVQQGQMVGVVEAMKVLNSIESEWTGTIVAVLAEDGASVEPGTALFRIQPTAAHRV